MRANYPIYKRGRIIMDEERVLSVLLVSGTMTPQGLNRNPWFQLSGALLKLVSPDQLWQTVQAVLRAPERDSR